MTKAKTRFVNEDGEITQEIQRMIATKIAKHMFLNGGRYFLVFFYNSVEALKDMGIHITMEMRKAMIPSVAELTEKILQEMAAAKN